MKAKTLCSTFALVTTLATAPFGLSAKTLGMVADDATDSVIVFDADTHAILGTVPIPAPRSRICCVIGEVIITPDQTRGFVTSAGAGDQHVFVIDLTTSPPSLTGGTNPIPVSNRAMDLSISPDGKFLVVSDNGNFGPISVIDIAAQAEISTFPSDPDTSSVEVCSDGSVLATSSFSANVRRLILSATGTLTDTGEVLSVSDPMNVYCAPGAQSGVVIQFETITSFTIPGLSEVDTRMLSRSNTGISGAINPSGNRVFARSNDPGSVDVFEFNSATGALGASPLLTFSVAEAGFLGIDQIALHPNGTKLFVSEPNVLNVYDPNMGALN
jgi:DNA-binding beta-propeller fold protein YncE